MPTKQSMERVHKLWCDAKSFEQGMHDLAEELDRRLSWPDTDGSPRLRVGIDIGGTVSKYPATFRHMVQAFMRAGNVAVHFISDMHDVGRIEDALIRNEIPYDKARVHSADYKAHGELCKKIVCEHHGIHVLIDDFPGYVAEGNFIRLLVMPNPHLPYYADEWATDGSEGNFGRRNPQKAKEQVVKPVAKEQAEEGRVFFFKTTDGQLYGLTGERINLLRSIYPGLPLGTHLENARKWCDKNPRHSWAVWPFLIRWLSREYQRMRLPA